jgi:hypothetical protein
MRIVEILRQLIRADYRGEFHLRDNSGHTRILRQKCPLALEIHRTQYTLPRV